jgi:dynein heavy chain
MNQPEKFLERVTKLDGREIDPGVLESVNKIINDPTKKYNEEDMKGQNFAASKLCAWSTNIVTFNRIYKEVRPLQIAKDKAVEDLENAMRELNKVKEEVRKLTEKVNNLKKQLAEAEEQKRIVEEDAKRCQDKLTAAEKLVNGLSGENKRWGENVQFLQKNIQSVIGDVLLASEFVSYIGAFSAKLRMKLWRDTWLPNIINKQIPMTEGIEPLKILTTEAIKAKWKNEGLPADTMSLENAAVISSCSRWPLLIDPQLQGSGWIRGSQGENLSTININQKHWMRELTRCISDGKAVLLEGIQEEIEATLEPLLTRAITKKGLSYYLEMGSDVIDYDPKFRLFLMTKLYNPHFRPEIAAQCTIINFIVTESGLEEQLLAMVVNVEKNELEVQKQELVKMQNEFQVELDRLESELLKELSDANPATILENKELIDKLDSTKKTAISIQEQSEKAKITEVNINAQREIYRPVAGEGAMLYFLLISLCIIDHMYQYSLEGFIRFFFKAI